MEGRDRRGEPGTDVAGEFNHADAGGREVVADEAADALVDEGPVLGAVSLARVRDPREVGPSPQHEVVASGVLDGITEQ